MKNKKIKIVLAIGSNMQQETHVALAKELLLATFEGMTFGKPMWTTPIGLPGSDKFLNLIGFGYTTGGRERTLLALKNIERKCGRRKSLATNGLIPIDIDLLLFDSERFHEADWQRPYMQSLLSQLGLL